MNCRVCSETDLELVLDLGEQPWCNHFVASHELGTEPRYPLRLCFCMTCRTAQLDHTVAKETMFGDHTYLSGITRTLDGHFAAVATDVRSRFFPEGRGASILDIGSNDGTQLKHFQQAGWDVLGVESSRTTAEIANRAGIPTRHAFFDQATAQDIGREFDVINASGVLFHLEDLHSVLRGIHASLTSGGVLVVQFLYMPDILDNVAFDQIYHEHLLYYSLRNLTALLDLHDLHLFDAHWAPIHGGSMIAYCGHRSAHAPTDRLQRLLGQEEQRGVNELGAYRRFAEGVAQMREDNLRFLDEANAKGKRVFGMGAPAKGNTLLNTFGIGPSRIAYLVERNPLRRGLFSPGSHIPVVIEDEFDEVPDIYYVLAWNFRNEILERYRSLRDRGVDFYFPISANTH